MPFYATPVYQFQGGKREFSLPVLLWKLLWKDSDGLNLDLPSSLRLVILTGIKAYDWLFLSYKPTPRLGGEVIGSLQNLMGAGEEQLPQRGSIPSKRGEKILGRDKTIDVPYDLYTSVKA